MRRDSHVSSLISHGFRYLPRSGYNTDFWNDKWTRVGSLKLIFPNIFALAHVKEGLIAQFGHWDMGFWHWGIELRRQTFNWEIEIWEDFFATLNDVYLDKSTSDRIV